MAPGRHSVAARLQMRSYTTYKSPYGPSYKIPFNLYGIDAIKATRLGATVASFGAVAGFFALYFFSEIPKVRKDIMQNLPVIGNSFIREIPPSDSPF